MNHQSVRHLYRYRAGRAANNTVWTDYQKNATLDYYIIITCAIIFAFDRGVIWDHHNLDKKKNKVKWKEKKCYHFYLNSVIWPDARALPRWSLRMMNHQSLRHLCKYRAARAAKKIQLYRSTTSQPNQTNETKLTKTNLPNKPTNTNLPDQTYQTNVDVLFWISSICDHWISNILSTYYNSPCTFDAAYFFSGFGRYLGEKTTTKLSGRLCLWSKT